MAKVGQAVFGKHETIDFEKAKRLGDLDSGTIFVVSKYDIFYSEKYEAVILAIETDEGELLTTFSETITKRVIKAMNMGLKLRGAVLQYVVKISDRDNEYFVLEQPSVEDSKIFFDARRKSKTEKQDKKVKSKK